MALDCEHIAATAAFLRAEGLARYAVYCSQWPAAGEVANLKRLAHAPEWIVCDTVASGAPGEELPAVPLTDIRRAGIGCMIAGSTEFPSLLRKLDGADTGDLVVFPEETSFIVADDLKHAGVDEVLFRYPYGEYLRRCGLSGHYVEFGTFYGRSFYHNYFVLHRYLRGRFFAFDSFAGLSKPKRQETAFTDGDFRHHAYSYSRRSFELLGKSLGADAARISIVEGYYDKTLRRKDIVDYGIAPQSVSLCYIDCDLFEPTMQVLEFILPALETGALVYFDDWRLARASDAVGERAAALDWLAAHPEIELIEFDRQHWQHQWFIFNRRARRRVAAQSSRRWWQRPG